MSLSGGGDAVVSVVDESVCCVNSLLADGILDLCSVDTVVSGVDESVCGVNSVTTVGDIDVFGCDSLVSDGFGDSSGVEVVDDVVACGDDILLPDAFRVGGWLSVVGLGVAQPGWVDGLICADDSLRPEPLPMHAMCLCRSLLAAAWYNRDMVIASASNKVCVEVYLRLVGYPCRYLFALYSVLHLVCVFYHRDGW